MNEQDVLNARTLLRRYRVQQNFDRTYQDKGGVTQLLRMANSHETISAMSEWFGLAQSRISTILVDVLGMTYSEYLEKNNITRSGMRNVGKQ